MAAHDASRTPPQRSCTGCTLCCKLLKIEELAKPAGTWCEHCHVETGCRTYPDRPQTCRDFLCNYLLNERLGEEWKPSKSKMVLTTELAGRRLTVYVDPQRPEAWKREPYYSRLKEWAANSAPTRGQIIVCIGRRMHMILPDRDVDLGQVNEDEVIVTGRQQTPMGIRLEAYKLHKDDPRAQQLLAGADRAPPANSSGAAADPGDGKES